MGRSKWKGLFIEKFVLNKLNDRSKLNYFNIWSRRSVISSNFISKKVFVYSGNCFKPVFITRDKVGFKFGEFSLTRVSQFKKKGNKKKSKNKK